MKSKHFLTTIIFMTVFIFLWAMDSASSPAPTPFIPEACQTNCATPYGDVLGITLDNVTAYSNCSANCVVPKPNKEKGIYTGIQWQCVEFARRWLLNHIGMVYGDVDTAADLWKLNTVTRVADGISVPFDTYLNGNTTVPQVGDLLIYAKEYLNTGHVAVITHLDKQSGEIKIAEQNFTNTKWPADYARILTLVEKGGKYWILDAYLLGWKRVSTMKR